MAEEGVTPLQRGNALLAEGDHAAAIDVFKEALQAGPTADVHEALARAYIKAGQYLDAAEAALKAVTLDPKQAKAYLRRGVALFHLDEFETALENFQKGKELRPTLAAFDDWIRKCRAEIAGEVEEIKPAEPERPAGGPKITIVPSRRADAPPSPSPPDSPVALAPSHPRPKGQQQQQQQQSVGGVAVAEVPVPGKIRHQWYQLGDKVVVDVFAKGLPKDRFRADFSDSRLLLAVLREPGAAAAAAAAAAAVPDSVAAPDIAAAAAGGGHAAAAAAEGPEWELDVELFGRVVPALCRYEVLRSKVEVTLRKAEPGKAWPTLEKSDRPALPIAAPPPPPPPAATVAAAAAALVPAAAADGAGPAAAAAAAASAGPPRQYPSSSAKGRKDWGAVEREVKEMEAKGELDDGDPLNAFFQKIFAGGDEDTRRAMMKSFVESNGTVLSTNWSEVGQKKVECTPPEGMELHKWGE